MPVVVGVPDTVPVFAPRERPAGSCPHEIANVYGAVPPLATTGTLYLMPTCAGTKLPDTFRCVVAE